VPLKVGAIKRM